VFPTDEEFHMRLIVSSHSCVRRGEADGGGCGAVVVLVLLAGVGYWAWGQMTSGSAGPSAASKAFDERSTDAAWQGLQRKIGVPQSWRSAPKTSWLPEFVEDWAADVAVDRAKKEVGGWFGW
jgi:hypothetical protein